MARCRASAVCILALQFAFAAALSAQSSTISGNWKKDLEAGLEAKYPLSKQPFLGRRRGDISHVGAVLVVRQPGIVGAASFETAKVNVFRDGKPTKSAGAATSTQTFFDPGDAVYVLEITVKDDSLGLHVLTRDPRDIVYSGTKQRLRYEAWVVFEFPKGQLRTKPFPDVLKTVDEVLVGEADYRSLQTKTVSLGQTPQQVEATLGKPDKIIDLGEKVTYIYKDMKVIFVNGRVVNVE
jgi:hypothetical protein